MPRLAKTSAAKATAKSKAAKPKAAIKEKAAPKPRCRECKSDRLFPRSTYLVSAGGVIDYYVCGECGTWTVADEAKKAGEEYFKEYGK